MNIRPDASGTETEALPGLALGDEVRTGPSDPNPLLFPSLVSRSPQERSWRAEVLGQRTLRPGRAGTTGDRPPKSTHHVPQELCVVTPPWRATGV